MSTKVLPGLYYSKTHEWLKVEGDIGYVGITDYAQHQLGDIVYVDLPNEGDSFEKDEVFGAVESVKAASDIMLPVSGEIIEVNEALNDEPELLNQDAFGNFIVKIRITDASELDGLMDDKAYQEFIK